MQIIKILFYWKIISIKKQENEIENYVYVSEKNAEK